MNTMRLLAALLMSVVTWVPHNEAIPLNRNRMSCSETDGPWAYAVCPGLKSAAFHPKNFGKPGLFQPFLFPPASPLAEPTKLHRAPPRLPGQIEELLSRTYSVDDAIRVLWIKLGWKPSPRILKSYMGRYAIEAPWNPVSVYSNDAWKARRRRPRVDPRKVQQIMIASANEGEVLGRLKREFDWALSSAEFRNFRKKYRLEIPPRWPYARRMPEQAVTLDQAS